jgi:hypothetical protein
MGGEEVEEVEVTSLQVDIGPEVAMVDRCRPDPRSRGVVIDRSDQVCKKTT